jgi:UDP-N-acetyl-2-amino-2-deoxyglucuronate dehydrogenase
MTPPWVCGPLTDPILDAAVRAQVTRRRRRKHGRSAGQRAALCAEKGAQQVPQERVYGFGVIGCGVISPVHLDAICRIPNARLVAVCDIREDRAQATAEKYGVPYTLNHKDLIARDDVDVVNIVTYSGTHADIGMDAARAGKHVICTKPIDVRLDKIDALIKACTDHKVKLGATHQFRSYGSYLRVKRAIDDGRLGRILYGNAFVPWWREPGYYQGEGAWHGTLDLDGGGALMNQSIHYVDLLVWMLGDVDMVWGDVGTLLHDIESEDIGCAVLRFASGAAGLVQGTTCTYKGLPARLEIRGERGNIDIVGDEIAVWDVEGEEPAAQAGESGETSAADPRAGLANAVDAHVVQISDVLRAIETDTEPALNGREARRAVEVILAIYRSSYEERAIRLPMDTSPLKRRLRLRLE